MTQEFAKLTQEEYAELTKEKRLVQVPEGIKLIKIIKNEEFDEFLVKNAPRDANAYMIGETEFYSEQKFVDSEDYPRVLDWQLVSVVYYQVIPESSQFLVLQCSFEDVGASNKR